MKHSTLFVAGALSWVAATAANPPLRLHPANPHYFEFRGKPTVLVTSGEHYGAVINLDFDYKVYLRTLKANGLNHTRVWAGAYREAPGDFGISKNTLAPAPGRFISPWQESTGKFDLTKWNDAYFARLGDFMQEASRNGIVVEMNLFCPFYRDVMWDLSPMNAKNNVNGIGGVQRTEALTLKDARLVEAQVAMVRKIVAELREFDNLFYEICNEPYFGGVTAEWQRHISGAIVEAEAAFPHRHLISENVANGSKKVVDPDPHVSIFNFHYSRPPVVVAENYALKKVIGLNETGFDGTTDATYRIQGWDFLIAGGALYNNLDYSFTTDQEEGTFVVPAKDPGGGSPALRRQLGILRAFFDDLPFVKMKPSADVITAAPDDASARVLAAAGNTYAVYLHRGREVKDAKPRYQVDASSKASSLSLTLPAGRYRAQWVDTRTGRNEAVESFNHTGGVRPFKSPAYAEDIVLKLSKR